jgi:membrane protein implicated in regulation of membrane protease activity
MPWWGWIIVGSILFGSELMLVDAAFYLVFIGAAAIVTGLVGMAGVGLELWMQWLLFSVLSVVAMLLFRDRLYKKLRAVKTDSGG